MSCLQHQSVKSRRTYQADAPYCRHADWWKNPAEQSREENAPSRYYHKVIGYKLSKKRRKTNWSILYLSSGLQVLTNDEQKFRFYAAKWKAETGHLSVIARRYENQSYKTILEMGAPAIPWILSELKRNPDRWFAALQKLTGENPAKDAVNFYEAVDRWVAWGIANDLIA
jgi:hypothetical protein